MSFREKIAWISVVATVIVWGSYFAFLLTALAAGQRTEHPYLGGLFGAATIQIVTVIVASVIAAATAPRDASAGSDERDRTIARRSAAIAYPVLLVGVVLVAVSLNAGLTAIDMGYGIMAAIVLAEIVHYGAQIAFYRSARHG